MSYMEIPKTYTLHMGHVKYSPNDEMKLLKSELEKKAFEKGIKLPDLIRRVLRSYIKNNPPQ